MQGSESPLLRLRNANDNAFCERLKQVIRCLSCWSFTRKAGENGFSEKKCVLTPRAPRGAPVAEGSWGRLPRDSRGSASGLLGSCQTPRIPSRRSWRICNEAAEIAARRGWGLHGAPPHRGAFRRRRAVLSKQPPERDSGSNVSWPHADPGWPGH